MAHKRYSEDAMYEHPDKFQDNFEKEFGSEVDESEIERQSTNLLDSADAKIPTRSGKKTSLSKKK